MKSYLAFILTTTFWLVMNFLLWRSTSRGGAGAPVSLATVTQRVLEAADTSTLLIRRQGNVMGQLRWTPAVLQDSNSATNALADEGMVTRRTGYAVDVDLTLSGTTRELRGHGTGRLEWEVDRTWRSLEFRWSQRPFSYELSAQAQARTVRLRVLQGTDEVFSESLPWHDPAALLGTFDKTLGGFGLVGPGLLASIGLPTQLLTARLSGTNQPQSEIPSDLLRWEARTAELPVRQQRIPTYQITGRFLDRYQCDVWIGRAGELLQAQLPGEIELRENGLLGLRP